MVEPLKYQYIIAGAGPTGISALETLLKRGVPPTAILIVDINPEIWRQKKISPERIEFTLHSVVARERSLHGLGKAGSIVLDKARMDSPLFYWGLSCYMPSNQLLKHWKVELEKFHECFESSLTFLEVQGREGQQVDAPILTQRKKLASKINQRNPKFENSWLALSSSGANECTLQGGCFENCIAKAPITPDRLLEKVTEKWGASAHLVSEITDIDLKNKSIDVQGGRVYYEKLLLCLGASNSQKLLAKSTSSEIALKGTPVALIPFWSLNINKREDFSNHFSYADLILPLYKDGEIDSFSQIYLPSVEIAGRILATMPRIIQSVSKILGKRSSQKVFGHIGICMIFLKESNLMETEIEAKNSLNEMYPELRMLLRRVQIYTFKPFVRYLLNGSSRHLGGISAKNDLNCGYHSNLWKELSVQNVFVLDTSLLPSIQPGPHTLIAIALSKYLILEMKI